MIKYHVLKCKRIQFKHLFYFLAQILLSLVLNSCSSSSSSSFCLKIAIHDSPSSIRPDQANTPLELSISKLLFEGLLRENANASNGVELAIAEKYIISSDQLTYTFFLNPLAKWSNGENITSNDVLLAWQYSKNNSYYKNLFDNLSFQVLSPLKLIVSLKEPDACLLKKLTSPTFAVFNPSSLNIYSGPFQLMDDVNDRNIYLIKNFHYYDSEKVYFNQIQFSVIPNIYTAVHLVQKGKYHLVGQPWHQGIPLELKVSQLNYHSYPINGYFWLLFNQKSQMFDSKEKSISFFQGLNVSKIIQMAIRDPHNALLTKNFSYTKEKQINTTSTKSNITLAYPSNILRCQRIAEAIREDCKHQGIHIDLDGSEYHLFRGKRNNYCFDIATATRIAYYPGESIEKEFHSSLKDCLPIPLYRMQYDFISSMPLNHFLYNDSGAIDLKYVHN